MHLSVIIPTLDEGRRIDGCLERLAAQPDICQRIVVDGQSSDDTVARACRHAGVEVLTARRGRGIQQNHGARAARGDTLLFLHADTELPAGAAATIRSTLAEPGVVAGAFRTWHVAERWRGLARSALIHLADVRSRYTTMPYGDQAMFMPRDVFTRVGGFPEIPLMEDLAISRKLSRLGQIRIAHRSVRVSARRFEANPLYQAALINVMPLLYSLGVPPDVLARLYGNPR